MEKDKVKETKENRRFDWRIRHQMIQAALTHLSLKLSSFPTLTQIQAYLAEKGEKISLASISKHMADLDFRHLQEEYKKRTPAVIETLWKNCQAGKERSQETWLNYVEGLAKKTHNTNENRHSLLDELSKKTEEELNAAIERLQSEHQAETFLKPVGEGEAGV